MRYFRCLPRALRLGGNYSTLSVSPLLSGRTNQALLVIRLRILPHTCSMNGVDDITCKTRQRYIESHNSAGGATVGVSQAMISLPAQ